MSAPLIYVTAFASPHSRRIHLGLWSWSITDGLTGPRVVGGTCRTEWGAHRLINRATRRCQLRKTPPVLHPYARQRVTDAQVAAVCDRLWADEHIWVEALVDEQRRVCVLPCCEVTTVQEVRVLAAFEALTSSVRWAGTVS